MENGKKLKFPEGREGVRGNRGFPLVMRLYSMAELLYIKFLRMKTKVRNAPFYPSLLQRIIKETRAKTCAPLSEEEIIT